MSLSKLGLPSAHHARMISLFPSLHRSSYTMYTLHVCISLSLTHVHINSYLQLDYKCNTHNLHVIDACL